MTAWRSPIASEWRRVSRYTAMLQPGGMQRPLLGLLLKANAPTRWSISVRAAPDRCVPHTMAQREPLGYGLRLVSFNDQT